MVGGKPYVQNTWEIVLKFLRTKCLDNKNKNIYYIKHMTTNSKEAKVYQLVQELEQAVKEKKAVVKGHNNNIKRIKDEIKDILELEQEEEADV